MKSKASLTAQGPSLENRLGRSYVVFCMEQALANIDQAIAVLRADDSDGSGEVVVDNWELLTIQRLIREAIEVA